MEQRPETTRIDATYRVVTPLFCGGANGNAELRLPSFKGVLRFWWRALAWAGMGGDLARIREEEDDLFGSASGRQSRILMRLAPLEKKHAVFQPPIQLADSKGRVVGVGARYLGYGAMEAFTRPAKSIKEGPLTRSYVRAPFDFTVQLRGRIHPEQRESLQKALIALGTLGGMGTKSRKGYGSLVLKSLQEDVTTAWKAPDSLDELRKHVNGLLTERGSLPEYTAFSKQSRVVLMEGDDSDPLALLDRIGREIVRYRSWGKGGKVLRRESERNFERDHNILKKLETNGYPRRIAFGLPHNGCGTNVGPRGNLDRRASPLLIHIHEIGSRPVGVLSFLPARFLPDGIQLDVDGRSEKPATESRLYEPVHELLDRFLDRVEGQARRKEEWVSATEVTR